MFLWHYPIRAVERGPFYIAKVLFPFHFQNFPLLHVHFLSGHLSASIQNQNLLIFVYIEYFSKEKCGRS